MGSSLASKSLNPFGDDDEEEDEKSCVGDKEINAMQAVTEKTSKSQDSNAQAAKSTGARIDTVSSYARYGIWFYLI